MLFRRVFVMLWLVLLLLLMLKPIHALLFTLFYFIQFIRISIAYNSYFCLQLTFYEFIHSFIQIIQLISIYNCIGLVWFGFGRLNVSFGSIQ